ncbi:MAG: methyltransferase domain-containing protein, partial [Promethearchaeota archaeon]
MENLSNNTSLVCPHCKLFLKKETNKYRCTDCSLSWQIKKNIPVFSDKNCLKKNDYEIKRLTKHASSAGWQEALFEYNKNKIEKDEKFSEDQRSADWRYLLPLNEKNEVLVIGCGLGTVPISLSEICKRVYIVDTDLERLTFIEIRKQQQHIKNIFPIYIDTLSNLPFADNSFDLVVIYFSSDFYQIIDQFRNLAICASRLLKKTGHAYFSAGNFISF